MPAYGSLMAAVFDSTTPSANALRMPVATAPPVAAWRRASWYVSRRFSQSCAESPGAMSKARRTRIVSSARS